MESMSTHTEKQQQILDYLRETEETYLKSRNIADELGMTASEVGTNMGQLMGKETDISIEKWGYTSGTTWMVT